MREFVQIDPDLITCPSTAPGFMPIVMVGEPMVTKNVSTGERRRVRRVLVIDPSVEDARRTHELLRADGEFVVQIAQSAAEAHALLDGGAFDVALIDYALWSERDGEVARCIREQHGDMAVVLLTNGENEREALPALKLGAHDFLSKQVADKEQVAARVLAAVEESRASRRRDTMVRWLEREARTDHLTGLFNRHAFDERLQEVCDRAGATDSPVTLVIIDVTGTRTVNEAYGHDTGDDMIRRAASGIARCIRASDFAARVGGDDFGIIVADGDIELGRRMARRIAQEVERLNAGEWVASIPVTLTFGVASGSGCEPSEIFTAADKRLTDSKTARPIISVFRKREDSNGPFVA